MDNRIYELLKSTIIYAIGVFGAKAIVLLLLPLYSFYLSSEEFGVFDLYYNLFSICYVIFSIQSVEIIFRYIQDCHTESDQKEIISNSLAILLMGSVAYILFSFVISPWTKSSITTYIIFLFVPVNMLYQFVVQLLRGLGFNLWFSIIGVISTIITAATVIVGLVYFEGSYEILFLSNIISNGLLIPICCSKIKLLSLIDFELIKWNKIKELSRFGLPLMPNSILLWSNTFISRWILLVVDTISSVGIFAFAGKLGQIIAMINSVFFMAWQRTAVQQYDKSDRNDFFNVVFINYFCLELYIISIILPLLFYLLRLTLDSNYSSCIDILPFIFCGTLFYAFGNFLSMCFYCVKNTKEIFKVTLMTFCGYVCLGFLLGSYYSYVGVALSYAISQIFYFILMLRKVKYDIEFRFNIRATLSILLCLISHIVSLYISSLAEVAFLAVCIIIFGGLINISIIRVCWTKTKEIF